MIVWGLLHSPIVILHSPIVILHSPIVILHSPIVILHSPIVILLTATTNYKQLGATALQACKNYTATVELFDTNGKCIMNQQKEGVAGNYLWEIDTEQLPRGIYFVRLTVNNSIFNEKITIVK